MLGREKRAAKFLSQVLRCEPLVKKPPSFYQIQIFSYLWLFPGLEELPSLTVTRRFIPSPQWSASKQLCTAPALAQERTESGCDAIARELPPSQGLTEQLLQHLLPHLALKSSCTGNRPSTAQVIDSAEQGHRELQQGEREINGVFDRGMNLSRAGDSQFWGSFLKALNIFLEGCITHCPVN